MNTPCHLIMGAAAFGKPASRGVTWAALAGGVAPDVSLYVMGGVAMFILGISPEVVFRDLYFSDAWQQVFAVDNSFILWGIGLAFGLFFRAPWAIALTGAALLHLAFDFPLHAEDARAHFWPLTDWKFISPISYWDSSAGGQIVGVAELALVALMTGYLLWRFKSLGWRALFLFLASLQIVPFFVWYLVF
ncbi:MAG: cobalamin biosynthesis protein CobQ [Pseudomonadota bacterium]